MDTTNWIDQLRLPAWLGLSPLVAAVVAAVVLYRVPFGLPPLGHLLAGS